MCDLPSYFHLNQDGLLSYKIFTDFPIFLANFLVFFGRVHIEKVHISRICRIRSSLCVYFFMKISVYMYVWRDFQNQNVSTLLAYVFYSFQDKLNKF